MCKWPKKCFTVWRNATSRANPTDAVCVYVMHVNHVNHVKCRVQGLQGLIDEANCRSEEEHICTEKRWRVSLPRPLATRSPRSCFSWRSRSGSAVWADREHWWCCGSEAGLRSAGGANKTTRYTCNLWFKCCFWLQLTVFWQHLFELIEVGAEARHALHVDHLLQWRVSKPGHKQDIRVQILQDHLTRLKHVSIKVSVIEEYH